MLMSAPDEEGTARFIALYRCCRTARTAPTFPRPCRWVLPSLLNVNPCRDDALLQYSNLKYHILFLLCSAVLRHSQQGCIASDFKFHPLKVIFDKHLYNQNYQALVVNFALMVRMNNLHHYPLIDLIFLNLMQKLNRIAINAAPPAIAITGLSDLSANFATSKPTLIQ